MNSSEARLLDAVLIDIEQGKIFEGMENLLYGLYEMRKSKPVQDWKRLIRQTLREHPLRNQIHQSPLSSRAFRN